MPPVELTQPVAGLRPGDPYSGPMESWLVAYGYAKAGDSTDKVDVTGPLAEHDPTLPENREAPGEDIAVKGEAVESPEEGNASEVLKEATVTPKPRSRRPGVDSSDEALKQAKELDGSVDPAKVTEKAEPATSKADAPDATEPTDEPTTEAGSEDKDAAVDAAQQKPAAGQSTPGAVEPTS